MPRRNPTHLNIGATVLLPLAIETKVTSHFLCNARCFSHRISSLISFKETGHLPAYPFPRSHVMWHPNWRSVLLIASCVYSFLSMLHGYARPCLHSEWRGVNVEKAGKCPTYRDQWADFSLLEFPDLDNKGALRRPGDPSITCCVSSYLAYLCTFLAHQPHKVPRHICQGNN